MSAKDSVYRERRQKAEVRRELVSRYYAKGCYSVRKIAEIYNNLPQVIATGETVTASTIQNDIKALLKEWRASRITNTGELVEKELRAIEENILTAWEGWEKSFTNQKKKSKKQKGALVKNTANDGADQTIKPLSLEQSEIDEINYGDPRFLAEIRNNQAERRKLLGLYAPEKQDTTTKIQVDLTPEAIKQFLENFDKEF